MSKVVGIIFTILGTLISLYTYFLIRNSNAYLPYNPTNAPEHASNYGLVLPMIIGLALCTAGITFLLVAKEDNSDMRS